MTGLEYLERTGQDVFCAVCGEWINRSPDLFGNTEGMEVDGVFVCDACADEWEDAEAGCVS